jgi:hypothetical protein
VFRKLFRKKDKNDELTTPSTKVAEESRVAEMVSEGVSENVVPLVPKNSEPSAMSESEVSEEGGIGSDLAIELSEPEVIEEEQSNSDLVVEPSEPEAIEERPRSSDLLEEPGETGWSPEKANSALKPTNSGRTKCQACQMEKESRSEIMVVFKKGSIDYASHFHMGNYREAHFFCRRCAEHRFKSALTFGVVNRKPARDGFGEVWFFLADVP